MNQKDFDIAALHETFANAVEEGVRRLKPEQVVETLIREMEENRRNVVLRLAGFANGYNGFELDHCNGRGGDSPISKALQEYARPVLEQFVKEAWDKELPNLRKKMEAAIQKHVKNYIERNLSRTTGVYVEQEAKALVEEMLTERKTRLREALGLSERHEQS